MADGADGSADRSLSSFRPEELVDLLEAFLLGEEPALTGREIAESVGITHEEAQKRWRSLGFSSVDADVPAFTHADQQALELTQRLVEVGLITSEDESAMARTLGRSFARLAEWQMGLLAHLVDLDRMGVEEVRELMETVVPTVEHLQSYVWRRHSLSAASRLLLAGAPDDGAQGAGNARVAVEHGGGRGGDGPGPAAESRDHAGADEPEGEEAAPDEAPLGVGFADIVNYTRQSRSMSRREIARMIDRFEDRALELVTAHRARVIKSIGDEILFVADDPEDLARLALALASEHEHSEDFPELRVGLAWGPALARLGDVLGPVVNIAARLTSTARPGRVLCDRSLAERLEDTDLRLKRLRRTSVRGYRRLEPWSLRAPRGDGGSAPGSERPEDPEDAAD